MQSAPRQYPNANERSTTWLVSRAAGLIGSDLTIGSRREPGAYYSAKILEVTECLFKINLPRRLAGHGYLRKSGACTINFIIDNVLYEAPAVYMASDRKVRTIEVTGEIHTASRRRFDRLPLKIKTGYAAVSDVTLAGGRLATVAWHWVNTCDISGGGILIETPIPAPVGSYLLMNLEMESFEGPMYIFGQVRWSGLSDTLRKVYHCGIMFIAHEELSIHFSPRAVSGIPDIMRQFDRKSRCELDACLLGLSGKN